MPHFAGYWCRFPQSEGQFFRNLRSGVRARHLSQRTDLTQRALYSTAATQRVDYGHFGPAFLTWHRYLNLWLEYEFQWLLKTLGRPNYYTFRAPYWDWRIESQLGSGIGAEDLFTKDRLGNSRLTNGLQVVFGPYSGWETICLPERFRQVCDPRESTGPLIRCPIPDRCNSSNPDWPTREHVNTALKFKDFDSQPWIQSPASIGFRNSTSKFEK